MGFPAISPFKVLKVSVRTIHYCVGKAESYQHTTAASRLIVSFIHLKVHDWQEWQEVQANLVGLTKTGQECLAAFLHAGAAILWAQK